MLKFSKVKACIICAVALALTILMPSPYASAEVSPDTLTPESIQQYSVVTKELVDNAFKDFVSDISGKPRNYDTNSGVNFITDYMLDNPSITAGEPTFTIPTYAIWQGKQLICYRLQDMIEHQILVEITIVHVDKPLEPSASIIHYDGIDYAPNAVNVAIYREDGSVNRYYISNTSSPNSKYLYTSKRLTWTDSIYSDIVSVSGSGENYSSIRVGPIYVDFPEVNSIANNLWLEDTTHEPYITGFINVDTGNNNLVDYITDYSILTGTVGVRIKKYNSESTDYRSSALNQYYASWVDTNNSTMNNRMTDNRQFSFNSYYVGGTTINNDNYANYYNGGLAPLFSPDIDWGLPDLDIPSIIDALLPDLKASISPSLDWVNNDLSAKIDGYLQFMPDFGFEWGTGTQNDYLQVFNPLPPVTSGGSGSGCNWITPSYPAYNTDIDIAVNVPELATATISPDVMADVGTLFSKSWDFAEILGLSALILPLFILGVIWRITGGD